MTDPTPPLRIEGLEIEALIARGGSASVYEAVDRRHSRKVAVKILDSRNFEEPRRRAFRRELQAMGRLSDHPHVLDVFASGFTEDGSPYLVMPLVATGTIAERIKRHEEFAVSEVLEVGVKLAAALETAHRRGILHCDIKPSNIFLDSYGDPLLGDLGISSIADSGITTTNTVSLTLMYAAPEIVQDGEHTVRSDIYSLGATLYAMLDLVPPFLGDSPASVISKIISATEAPLLSRNVPPQVAAALGDMMAIDPNDRVASAADVVRRLQLVQEQLGQQPTQAAIGAPVEVVAAPVIDDPGAKSRVSAASGDSEATVSPREVAGQHKRRRKFGALAAAAALVLLLGGIALGVTLNNSEPTTAIAGAPQIQSDEVLGVTEGGVTEGGDDEDSTNAAASGSDEEGSASVAAVAPTATAVVTASPEDTVTADPTSAPTSTPGSTATEAPTPQPAAPAVPTATPPPTAAEATPTPEPAPAVLSIAGRVEFAAGAPSGFIGVDLFLADTERPRGDFIEGLEPGADGLYGFDAPPGCYVLTFAAPDGFVLVDGGKFENVPVCVGDDVEPVIVNRAVVPEIARTAQLTGRVLNQATGLQAPEVKVDAFLAENGSRGDFFETTTTDSVGLFSIDVPSGCYILTLVAPDGTTLVGGDKFLNSPQYCMADGESANFDAQVAG